VNPLIPATQSGSPSAGHGAYALPVLNWKAGATLGVLLAVFFTLQALLPLQTAILLGADEGFELAKASLCLRGYHLYTEIWNDQPPLHTFLVTKILKHISPSAAGPRILTGCFSALLLGSLFWIVLRVNGLFTAALATAFLLASPGFLLLGSSCMLEVPALAPAVAALAVLVVGSQTKFPLAVIAAGCLFGIACEIKLISVVLLLLAGFIIWVQDQRNNFPVWRSARSWLIFCGSLAVSTIAADLIASGGSYLAHFQQSWASHFGGTKTLEYGSPNDYSFDWGALLRNWDVTVPAVAGAFVCFRRRSKDQMSLLPVAWLILTLTVFGIHRPWWRYYYVHTSIPICWCAAVGVAWLIQVARARRDRTLFVRLILYLLCAAAWMAALLMCARLYLQVASIRNSPQTFTCLFLKDMERYKPQTHWLYTEEPVYSFHAGIPMPPDLAVLVLKRYWSGEMTNARLTADLRSFKPELILLRNDSNPRPFRDLINLEYQLIYMDDDNLLYVLKSIARSSKY
jgi:hypothetical protein